MVQHKRRGDSDFRPYLFCSWVLFIYLFHFIFLLLLFSPPPLLLSDFSAKEKNRREKKFAFYRVLFGSEFSNLPLEVEIVRHPVCSSAAKKRKRENRIGEGGKKRENPVSAHAHTPLRARASISSALLACISSQSRRNGCSVRTDDFLVWEGAKLVRFCDFSPSTLFLSGSD